VGSSFAFCTLPENDVSREVRAFYRQVQLLLCESEIPFLVGGTFAMSFHAGLCRRPKDFDVFVQPDDWPRVRELFVAAGYRVELTFPHWLGKIFEGDRYVDIIFSSGNGVAKVDGEWFEHSVAGDLLGLSVRFCPCEELIWTKAYVMERERYDGADIAHLLRARASKLDWPRLLRRFGPHWEVLLSHLILFRFICPGKRDSIPTWVLTELVSRVSDPRLQISNLCQGTLLSREQYLTDVQQGGDADARVFPPANMSPADIATWTDAIAEAV
jgi:hypothetical protein